MYGPGTGTGSPAVFSSGSGMSSEYRRGPPKERKYTPPGQMSAGANQRPPLQGMSVKKTFNKAVYSILV